MNRSGIDPPFVAVGPDPAAKRAKNSFFFLNERGVFIIFYDFV
jgi:hypothetical protein